VKFSRLFFGLSILLIGFLALGINFGWWGSDVFRSLSDLWPLLIVVIGINILFGKNSVVAIIILFIFFAFSVLYIANYKNINGKIGIRSLSDNSEKIDCSQLPI
jgi:hypothetical protein